MGNRVVKSMVGQGPKGHLTASWRVFDDEGSRLPTGNQVLGTHPFRYNSSLHLHTVPAIILVVENMQKGFHYHRARISLANPMSRPGTCSRDVGIIVDFLNEQMCMPTPARWASSWIHSEFSSLSMSSGDRAHSKSCYIDPCNQ